MLFMLVSDIDSSGITGCKETFPISYRIWFQCITATNGACEECVELAPKKFAKFFPNAVAKLTTPCRAGKWPVRVTANVVLLQRGTFSKFLHEFNRCLSIGWCYWCKSFMWHLHIVF